MPSIVAQDSASVRRRERALLPLFDRLLPVSGYRDAVRDFVSPHRRDRLLPAELTLQVVIAMNLYARDALTLVVAKLLLLVDVEQGAPLRLPSKSAITQARQRLGVAPVHALFHRLCVPLATPSTPGAFLGGLRVMAIDGTIERAADTPANTRAFGKHSSQYGPSAFPLVLVCALVECGTHAIVDAVVGPGHADPMVFARRLVRTVTREMLVLLDRGLTVWPVVWALHRRGAHLLGRVASDRLLPPLAGYPDGSYQSLLFRDPPSRRTPTTPAIPVRVIVYRLDLPGWPHDGETTRLVTTLLDAERYPARTLIAAEHERWEIELTIDEVDTHQRPVGQPLRSKTPQLVIQELFGLFIAHYLVRAAMVQAAATRHTDPDRLSFVHAIGLVQVVIPVGQTLSAIGREQLQDRFAQTLHRYVLPPREHRSNPRVVRRKSSKFPRKTMLHRGQSLRTPFLDAILPSALGAALTPQVQVTDTLQSAA
jgi:hypothetical protein